MRRETVALRAALRCAALTLHRAVAFRRGASSCETRRSHLTGYLPPRPAPPPPAPPRRGRFCYMLDIPVPRELMGARKGKTYTPSHNFHLPIRRACVLGNGARPCYHWHSLRVRRYVFKGSEIRAIKGLGCAIVRIRNNLSFERIYYDNSWLGRRMRCRNGGNRRRSPHLLCGYYRFHIFLPRANMLFT